ncbi:MAG: hypothetical protein ACOY35_01965 [Bacillota bacterium]
MVKCRRVELDPELEEFVEEVRKIMILPCMISSLLLFGAAVALVVLS